MPYLPDEERKEQLQNRVGAPPTNAAEINFVICDTADTYLYEHGITYQTINDVLGAIEAAKLEFVRRIVGPYEETKLVENGDAFPLSIKNLP